MKLRLFTIAIIFLITISMRAEVRLASVITDHAVLQRDAPIHLWGEASPAEQLTITFHDQSLVYGETGLELSGPLYRQTTREGGGLRVWFDHAEGLHSDGTALQGFEVAGTDGHFVPTAATVQGGSVVITSPEVAEPAQVRYAWQNFTDANLYNGVPLPASTFVAEVP